MTIALTHIALHVDDLGACISFYQAYAGLALVHDRVRDGKRVVWLAEPGREQQFILVLIPGGPRRAQADNDFSHLGFAVASKQSVDAIAARAKADGCLQWAPRQEPYPVGYYCGVQDPNGNFVEFSYGQPLGPGAQ
ncbi:MAG: VOC family protein [Gammaproteobacteria bacterium]|nr:VOC family protein [Gammaproteobacteria bacterium]